MTDVTQILSQIEDGAPSATEKSLPFVYDELSKIAAAKPANEKPGKDSLGNSAGTRCPPPASGCRKGSVLGSRWFSTA